MNSATEKQKKFAEAIAKKLEIELPEEDTKEAYFSFIAENKDKYYALKKGKA